MIYRRNGREMLRKLLVVMMAGMLGVPLPVLSWAGSGNAGSPATALSMSEGAAPDAVSLSAPDEEGYLIGAGDELSISVWKDDALTRLCVVRPDGAISFPLIGDIQAAERSASQLKAEIEAKLARYVPGAVLSLEVRQVNSLIIYVVGRVNAPGRFVMNTNVDVLQALATAGGVNPFAKRNRIKVFRKEKNKTTLFPFEYDEVVGGKRLEQNIRLKRGDVVVVP